MRCIVIRGDAWLVLLSPFNTRLITTSALPINIIVIREQRTRLRGLHEACVGA